MSVTGSKEGSEIQVDLKYCERCGGLWLRPRGNHGVYCTDCCVCLRTAAKPFETSDESPRRKRRRRAVRDAKNNVESSGFIVNLQGVAESEVWA